MTPGTQIAVQRSVDDFIREERAAIVAAQAETPALTFIRWATKVPEPKSGELDFYRFPFQRELYETTGKVDELVVKKATQIGISAFLIRWAMWRADVRGWTVMYVFPNERLMKDFSDLRFKPLVEEVAFLRSRIRKIDTNNKGMKRIGAGHLFLRGSETKTALDSVDADALALDEYDTLDQYNLEDAERRLSGSTHGHRARVGVPSIAEYGISEQYEDSDQRVWLVQCPSCNEHQELTFENIDQVSMTVVCVKCRRGPLPVAEGQWVAKYPSRDIRGYHCPRIIVPEVAANQRGRLEEIVKASKSSDPLKLQTHFNKDLALPFDQPEGRLSRDAIAAAQRDYVQGARDAGYSGPDLVTMGVDVASVRALNVRISRHLPDGRKVALYIGLEHDFQGIVDLMGWYDVKMACVDHEPDGRMAMALAEKFPGRVYLIAWGTTGQVDVIKVDDDRRKAYVDRTKAYDATFGLIRLQHNLLPMDLPEDYVKHMTVPYRHVEEDELGRPKVRYIAKSDHDYAQAEAYDVCATQLWAYRQGVDAILEDSEQPLDDLVEDFERSQLAAPPQDDEGYTPGPSGIGYDPGPEDGYDYGPGGY